MPKTRRHPEQFKGCVYRELFKLFSDYQEGLRRRPTGERTHSDQNGEFAKRKEACLKKIRRIGEEVGMTTGEVQELIEDTFERVMKDYNIRPKRG